MARVRCKDCFNVRWIQYDFVVNDMTVSETSLFEEYVLPETKVFREEYSTKKNQDPKMEVLYHIRP